MGYGFIPTPNSKEKEEEFLILEGLRFVDRVGKIDRIIAANGGNDHFTEPRGTVNDNASADRQTNTFTRDKSTPKNLYYSQSKEPQLTQNVTKTLVKEFNGLNSRLIDNVTSGPSKRFNLPKTARLAILNLKKLVVDKKIDIRKVDKGQRILIIDYDQRIKAEELTISTISKICEEKMKELYHSKFIGANELVCVTGILAGGKSGKLKNNNGTMK